MSFFSSLTNKSKLNSANEQTTEARNSEGEKADDLFAQAYKSYQQIISSDEVFSEALHNWGFAQFNQAKTKKGDEAEKLYLEATEKFAFSALINPTNLKAAIDWGVALMELARLKGVEPQDSLYDQALEKLLLAESITPGSTTYNLACIYCLRGDFDAVQKNLEKARDFGSLPDKDEIINDPDLAAARRKKWFKTFLESLDLKKNREEERAEQKARAKEIAAEKLKAKEEAKALKEAEREAGAEVKKEEKAKEDQS